MDRPTSSDLRESGIRLDHPLVSDIQPGANSDLFQQQRAELVQQTNNLVDAKTLPGIDLFDGNSIGHGATADNFLSNSDPSTDATPGATESPESKGQPPAKRVPEDTASTTPTDGLGPTDQTESNEGVNTETNQTPAAISDNKDQPQNGTSRQDDGSNAGSSAWHGSTHQDELGATELKASAGPGPLDGNPPLLPRPGQQHPTDDSR